MSLFFVLVIRFLQIFIEIITWALFVHVLLSWFAGNSRTSFGIFLEKIVQPILWPFRWAKIGVMDFSILAAFLVINYGGNLLIGYLQQLFLSFS